MAKKIVDTILPTTMVGSYPRPSWYKQQLLGRFGEGLDTAHDAVLDRSRRGPLTRDPEPACELRRGYVSRHLEYGQRNATRLGDDAVSHARVDPAHHH